MNKNRHALISVFDKKNIFSICQILNKYNVVLISTGSTAKEIRKNAKFKIRPLLIGEKNILKNPHNLKKKSNIGIARINT